MTRPDLPGVLGVGLSEWDGLTPPYSTIVADPPWPQKGAGALRGREGWDDSHGPSKPMPYKTMTLAEIKALPVGDLAAEDGHLYLWTTNRFLPDAFAVAQAWGFSYSTLLVWSKKPMGGGLGGCYGISTEYVLFCRRGSLQAKAKVRGTSFGWKRPYDERGKPKHSAKPPEFFRMVEEVSPGPHVELFARQPRLGWDVWGDEIVDPEPESVLAALGALPTNAADLAVRLTTSCGPNRPALFSDLFLDLKSAMGNDAASEMWAEACRLEREQSVTRSARASDESRTT